jgi:FAD/FMN-containing dehydrogenase
MNLQALNSVTVSPDRKHAIIQAGALIKDVVTASYAASTRVMTGNCNPVGHISAVLGGGYGNNMGLTGFGVDQVESLDVVLADGEWKRGVTQENEPDLWFALLGAGPNFGIVTSITIKATPTDQEDLVAWLGQLVFAPEKIEAVISAVQDLRLTQKMVVFIYFLTTGPPDFDPFFMLAPLYHGSVEEAKKAFAPLVELGPLSMQGAVLPWPEWNNVSDPLSTKGGFKNIFSAGHDVLDPATYRATWEEYVAFSREPTAGFTGFVTEAYPQEFEGREGDINGTSFPNRRIRFNSFVGPWYADAGLHEKAGAFGEAMRRRFRETGGLEKQLT